MPESIKKVLMNSDGLTSDEAKSLINDAQEQLARYIDEGDMDAAEEICAEFFGLAPDYLIELL